MVEAYVLNVWHEGETQPRETLHVRRPVEVMAAIPTLLKKHAGCHRIHVHSAGAHLFSVDCDGNTVTG